jgi:N-acyl-D-aspartate/D-glutamate deacylase
MSHTHDDFAAVKYPDMAFKLTGESPPSSSAPWIRRRAVRGGVGDGERRCTRKSRFRLGRLSRLCRLPERNPTGTNIGILIGHGTVRLAAMGMDKRSPSASEMSAMKATFAEGLEAGALGYSTGLVYDPGRFAATEELIELATLLRGTGALYATHMRDEGQGLLMSVREAIEIGEKGGIPVQISHHKASGRTAWGKVGESLKLIEAAQRRGLDVHADQYPYTAGSTILAAIFREGKLRGVSGDLRAEDVVIASTAHHPQWEGKSLAALATEMGCTMEEAATRILAEDSGVTAILHAMCEEDVRTVMSHPSTMIGSDGIPTLEGKPHPRAVRHVRASAGAYARDENCSLAEGVHRMTGVRGAQVRVARSRRGQGKARAPTSCLFDPRRIIDRGTWRKLKRTPEGIEAVYVNGVKAVSGGKLDRRGSRAASCVAGRKRRYRLARIKSAGCSTRRIRLRLRRPTTRRSRRAEAGRAFNTAIRSSMPSPARIFRRRAHRGAAQFGPQSRRHGLGIGEPVGARDERCFERIVGELVGRLRAAG